MTLTPTITQTPTITRTPTETRTPTNTPRPGVVVTYLGLARPDDSVIEPSGTTDDGLPIYERPVGFLFSIVVEGRPFSFVRGAGRSTFRFSPGDPSARPDMEMLLSNPIGNGSAEVCDNMLPIIGGVPSIANFEQTQEVANALNDLGCRFVDGSGQTIARSSSEACTSSSDGGFRFVDSTSLVQFCGLIAEAFSFPVGDTTVTVRLRDQFGVPGPESAMVIRVGR